MEVILIAILALALLVVVILVVSAPLRAAWSSQQNELALGGPAVREGQGESEREDAGLDEDGVESTEERVELEAEREAKYREIRDTELDYRTGKLSQEDFTATDSVLRAEAVEILDRLAALEPEGDTEPENPRPRAA